MCKDVKHVEVMGYMLCDSVSVVSEMPYLDEINWRKNSYINTVYRNKISWRFEQGEVCKNVTAGSGHGIHGTCQNLGRGVNMLFMYSTDNARKSRI